eukprot:scaffold3042_cov127-Skeletonema_dohrnii-CCMP3373.AAC.23
MAARLLVQSSPSPETGQVKPVSRHRSVRPYRHGQEQPFNVSASSWGSGRAVARIPRVGRSGTWVVDNSQSCHALTLPNINREGKRSFWMRSCARSLELYSVAGYCLSYGLLCCRKD